MTTPALAHIQPVAVERIYRGARLYSALNPGRITGRPVFSPFNTTRFSLLYRADLQRIRKEI